MHHRSITSLVTKRLNSRKTISTIRHHNQISHVSQIPRVNSTITITIRSMLHPRLKRRLDRATNASQTRHVNPPQALQNRLNHRSLQKCQQTTLNNLSSSITVLLKRSSNLHVTRAISPTRHRRNATNRHDRRGHNDNRNDRSPNNNKRRSAMAQITHKYHPTALHRTATVASSET